MAKTFWTTFEDSPTKASMMLNENADLIDPVERPEVLSYLPPLEGVDVVELGAGIGRYTSDIADQQAKSVRAMDFIQGSCDVNAQINSHRANVEVHCQDVKTLELAHDSVDLVFSNWLFMYLSDAEVSRTFSRIVQWLRPGGHFFLRESCDVPSSLTVLKDMENPTRYRSEEDYQKLLQDAAPQLSTKKHGVVQAYVAMQNLTTQKYWLLQKSAGSETITSDEAPLKKAKLAEHGEWPGL